MVVTAVQPNVSLWVVLVNSANDLFTRIGVFKIITLEVVIASFSACILVLQTTEFEAEICIIGLSLLLSLCFD